jgi:hypothetical protein
MQCPNCGTAAESGAVFCSVCGASLSAEVALTQPMPGVHVPPPLPHAAEPVAAPEPPPASEFVEPPPMPAGAVSQQPVAQQTAYASPQPPAKKKRTGCIIAVVAIILLGCIGVVVGGVLFYMPFREVITEIPTPTEVPPTTEPTTPDATGFTTAEEALKSVMAADWVFKATRTTESRVTYWTGPPNSEYVDEIVVEKGADGTWTVTDQYSIGGGDVSGDAGNPAMEEAVAVLSQFLDYIKADNPEEAHKLTVEPFSYDAASAGYSNGEFLSYEIVETTAQDDGTFWIHVTETWKTSTNDWGYYLVPTDAGYRISDLKPW